MSTIITKTQPGNWNNIPIDTVLFYTGRAFSTERPNAMEFNTIGDARKEIKRRGYDDVEVVEE